MTVRIPALAQQSQHDPVGQSRPTGDPRVRPGDDRPIVWAAFKLNAGPRGHRRSVQLNAGQARRARRGALRERWLHRRGRVQLTLLCVVKSCGGSFG